jgi:LacI family transcriptional regulator
VRPSARPDTLGATDVPTSAEHDDARQHAKRPTLEDVARLAAVSTATVSRVINGSPKVTGDTRRTVERAVARLGYRPSFAGRALALRRTATIGVVVADIRNPFFPEIVHAVEREAREHGYLPILCDIEGSRQGSEVRRLVDHGVDGLLVASMLTSEIDKLPIGDLPIVLINEGHPAFDDSYVIPDYRAGAALATRHLAELGHERIAHIRGPLAVYASAEREQGYLDELDAQGLEYVRSLPVPDFSPEAGRAGVHKLMGLKDPPTAVFVVNDYCALGVLHGLQDLGLAVPRDVAVVGYDDIWPARLPSIALTTVSSRIEAMSTVGTRMLLDMIATGELRADPVVLEPELAVRSTTA